MKLIMTKGLPASGKSTWAKKMVEQHPGIYKRVNKDDLRAMLDNGRWSKANEEYILEVRDFLIKYSLQLGLNVIVDDTNLHPKHEIRMQEIIDGLEASGHKEIELEVKDFTDIPLEECIKRDQKRPNYVGEKVIKQMYKQYLKPLPAVTVEDPNLPSAVICDIDGTLALFGDKNPYERDFENDTPNPAILDILYRIDVNNFNGEGKWTRIIFCSGRKEKFRGVTRRWLDDLGFSIYPLYMRGTEDLRKDYVVKQEIYEKEIKNKYNVLFVIDDRNQVVEMWREQGLTCLQVAEGDF